MKRALVASLLLAACRGQSPAGMDTPDARESPQASAQPAQLAALPPRGTTPSTDGYIAPLRGDEVLPADVLATAGTGFTLTAVLRQADVAGPPRANEVNAAGLDAARRATETRLTIDFTPTRLRVVLGGHGFVLPEDAEIRARGDRYGHVFVPPEGNAYHPLAPGSLRALLGERRFDVAPITPAGIELKEETGRRIGIKTRRAELSTRAAKATWEIGHVEGAGEGGVLLCRLLLDLMNAAPADPVCAGDEVPLRAEIRWTSHGSLVFEATGAMKRTDLALASLVVPPPDAAYAGPLPTAGAASMLSAAELAALRLGDVDVGPTTGDALTVANGTTELRVFWLDGVAAAWVAPGGRGELRGLRRGRYTGQWRTFLGDAVENPYVQISPGAASIGIADAGAPR